jgi:hypothetical protein
MLWLQEVSYSEVFGRQLPADEVKIYMAADTGLKRPSHGHSA